MLTVHLPTKIVEIGFELVFVCIVPQSAHKTRRTRECLRAISPSLHEGFDVHLPGSQARGPDGPDLPLIHPRVLFGGGGEPDASKEVEYRLAVSRRRLAVARQSDPVAIIGLHSQVEVELHAPISADSQIVEAVRPARDAPFRASINCKVKSGSLQWNLLFASDDGVHTHAVVRNSSQIEFLFVNLLAPHCSDLSHSASPG